MKKEYVKPIVLLGFCWVFFCASAQLGSSKITFNREGKFKIVQFTDIHWKPGVKESEEALVCMNNVLDVEKPDFVFFTGDLVTGSPAREGLDIIFRPVLSRNIPFAVTLGNHDDEQDMTRQEIYEYMKTFPGNLTGTIDGLSGVTNFTIPVYQSDGEKIASILYGLDTNLDTLFLDQVVWFTQQSKKYTELNKGNLIPSLAFFHIPLPEFKEAIQDVNSRFYGIRKEKECCLNVNAGLFSAFLERGDIMAAFVGHDHLNDYVVCWKGIMLCYGRVTGSRKTSHYNLPDGSNGARVIELTEGERSFESWIRLRTGEKIKPFKFPFDFIDK
ncbi:MAG: metallophosphoesterase family protein [Massilibacteroides sp.]|nr:metallophosphoesterase family protein [Massilibacteroides sp.]